MSGIHVYLGPSLDRKTATQLLPEANYHPPVKCGDLISLLRLSPSKIIIIDGFYETAPAAWHKEILLAMELGVAVWGAASIGALRAAELYQFGMQGFGQIYHDFKTGVLTDDDEVAVLHGDQKNGYLAINDTMVNIRYTCQEALDKNIISSDMKERLVSYCKAQFYPYRSLMNAALHLTSEYPLEIDTFIAWLREHGLVDMKRQDAMTVLRHCAANDVADIPKLDYKTPMTMFLRNTTYYANLTPFKHDCDGLPQIEHQLQYVYRNALTEYRLVAELAHFSRCLFSLLTEETLLIEQAPLISYMHEHALYLPDQDFSFYKTHAQFSGLYALVCQSICMANITHEQIDKYLPIIAHYYDLESDVATRNKPILRILLVLIFSIELKFEMREVYLSPKNLKEQLRSLFIRRAYSKEKRDAWSFPSHLDEKTFYDFLSRYFKITTVYYPESPVSYYYFKWMYDAFNFYVSSVPYWTRVFADESASAPLGA
ncbi:MAG: TfuA-like protein [Gammaproteobacteria bacterium]|nr:TfuA-like protein [Gammaproteobacteria bacterium]